MKYNSNCIIGSVFALGVCGITYSQYDTISNNSFIKNNYKYIIGTGGILFTTWITSRHMFKDKFLSNL